MIYVAIILVFLCMKLWLDRRDLQKTTDAIKNVDNYFAEKEIAFSKRLSKLKEEEKSVASEKEELSSMRTEAINFSNDLIGKAKQHYKHMELAARERAALIEADIEEQARIRVKVLEEEALCATNVARHIEHEARNRYLRILIDIYDKTKVLEEKKKELDEKKEFINSLTSTKISEFPVLATIISDCEAAKDEQIADMLETRKRRALTAAKAVRQIKEEKRALIAQNKAYQWELEYLRQILPWLPDLEDSPLQTIPDTINPDFQKEDAAGYWLTPEEYEKLSTIDKYQLALDRYKKRNKSNAEIGRDYERYIGYLYEQAGYSVRYFGIEHGLEDLGRDLVCTKGATTHIVQCKCWSNLKKKEIHENHINQLYGTTLVHKIENCLGARIETLTDDQINSASQTALDLYDVRPVFCSTVPFSKTARAFANVLGITCKIVPLGEYPMIKCNISRRDGDRIYHLPFDQQYDRCVMTPKDGEFYAMTVEEAETKGFRRALRWHSDR